MEEIGGRVFDVQWLGLGLLFGVKFGILLGSRKWGQIELSAGIGKFMLGSS